MPKNDNATCTKEADHQTQQWDDKVGDILRAVRREGKILFALGAAIYVAACVILYLIFGNASAVGIGVIVLFELMVIYMATMRFHFNMKGGFLTGLESQRNIVPATRKLADIADKTLEEEIRPVISKWNDLADRLDARLSDDLFDQLEDMLDSAAFSREPLPPAEPVTSSVRDNGKKGNIT